MTPFFRRAVRCFAVLFAMTAMHLKADEVDVYAAASLVDALKEVASGYEKTGGDHIVFNLNGSNVLAMQIEAGAPADIFFSADEAKMNELAQKGLIDAGTRQDILSNTLVVVVPGDSSATLTSAAGLTDAKFARLALGDPRSVPAGVYAKAYLQKIGVWDQVSSRVVALENVRAALAAVETGNADAGIVYKSDAQHSKKVKVAYEVPRAEGPAITYPLALLRDAKHAAAAKKFISYLESPKSAATFAKYGFITKGS